MEKEIKAMIYIIESHGKCPANITCDTCPCTDVCAEFLLSKVVRRDHLIKTAKKFLLDNGFEEELFKACL